MKSNIEKEYKLLVTKEQFYNLLKQYPDIKFDTQINYYIDTEDTAIRNLHGAMRIRHVHDMYIFTLKLPSKDGLLEFEKEVQSTSLEVLHDKDIQQLFQKYHIHGTFKYLTTLTTQRAIYHTEYAELCFDINTYHGITDYEIEYEYKKEHDGIIAFQEILKSIQVTYTSNCDAKIKRALDSL